MSLNAGRTIRLTHVESGRDFEIGPSASAADNALAERLWHRLSREPLRGRHVVECREHDTTGIPELVQRRDPVTGRVPGIYVYLRKLDEGTPKERWSVVHFDGRASHEVRTTESEQHKREKDAWSDAAETAGYRVDQEVSFKTGVKCDVVIYGPTTDVDVEVQRYHLKTSTAQKRTRKAENAGLLPIWSTDRQTDWTRRNAVPHIRTNELPEHTVRDRWLVVGGVREVLAERCAPAAFQVCPRTSKGVFCGQFHAKLRPPADGSYRVYEVAELAPAGGLVSLATGRGPSTVLVRPDHRDLWHELAVVPVQRASLESLLPRSPLHRDALWPGIGELIDHRLANRPPSPVSDPDHASKLLLDLRLYSPAGVPWCRFEAGSLYCVNDPCHNPNHRRRRDRPQT